jgi:molecular chaperone Hsp33
MKDHMIRILSRDGSLRASSAVTTTLVAEICRLQGADPTAAVALGRLVTGAAQLAVPAVKLSEVGTLLAMFT